MPKSPDNSTVIIVVTGVVGILFSLLLLSQVAAVKLDIASVPGTKRSKESEESNLKLVELYNAISIGASSFLNAEYKLCALFVVVVFPALSVLIAWGDKTSEASWAWPTGLLSGLSFVVGAVTSMLCGFIGMRVAVFSNARCTVGACSPTVGWTDSFNTAFKAGGVMGFSLTGIALLSLYALICVLRCARSRAAPRPTVPMHAPTHVEWTPQSVSVCDSFTVPPSHTPPPTRPLLARALPPRPLPPRPLTRAPPIYRGSAAPSSRTTRLGCST